MIKTPGREHFKGEYIPNGLWPYLDPVYDVRPAVEKRYSLDNGYGLTIMPHRGKRWAHVPHRRGWVLTPPQRLDCLHGGRTRLDKVEQRLIQKRCFTSDFIKFEFEVT